MSEQQTPAEAAATSQDMGPIRELVADRPPDVLAAIRVRLVLAYQPRYDGFGVALPGGFMIVTARRCGRFADQRTGQPENRSTSR